jgi:hypothetical protein
MITVMIYQDGNDSTGTLVGVYAAEREARRAAARALGARSLRGASSWPAAAGVVYQFGRPADTDANPCAELIFGP